MSHTRWIVRILVAVAIVAAFALGRSQRDGAPDATPTVEHGTEPSVWTCSMHPQIQLPDPGLCPICAMDLIPLEKDGGAGDGPRTLTLSPAARSLAEVSTTNVERREVEMTLRMVGKLEADETRIREISAWVDGRIDRLYIDYTGVPVRAGQKLFDLYSPELYSAQEVLLQAIGASEALSRSALESTRASAARTVEAARERLRLWGLTETQIRAIESSEEPSDHITIVAPMSGIVLHKDAVEGAYVKTGQHVYAIADLSVLWLKLDVYEADLAWVRLGDEVEFETDAFRGEHFPGTVSFIDPVLDERSRSVKVRVNVENPDGRLKPGMFARAVVHARISGDDEGPPLVIPASAPLVTGKRAVVYVQDPDEEGRFHGREVVLGPEAGNFIVVREGLDEGERVVSHGSFKIDSALQILAKPSMMNEEGGGPPPGHHHGHGAGDGHVEADVPQVIDGVPASFRKQFDPVLAVYFATGSAFAHDDLGAAQDAATGFPAALDAVDHGVLPPDGHGPWNSAQEGIAAAAKDVALADDIDEARASFETLSNRLIATVQSFGASGETPVLVYHCPMAMGGEGADWLQAKEGTENPYYGSKMFRCGSQTGTLAAGPNAAGDAGE